MMESASSVAATPQHIVEIFERLPAERTIADEINDMLKYYAYDDAIYLAELYFETEKRHQDPEALLLYADCLYRANRKQECFGLLQSQKLSGARLFYLYAKVSFELNRIDECRGALFEHDNGALRDEILDDPPVAAHARILYSYMLCDESHMDLALESVEKALEDNVLLWSAITTYLRFGGRDLAHVFEKFREKINGSGVPSPAMTIKSPTPSPSGPSTSTASADARATSQGPASSSSIPTRRSSRLAPTSATRGGRQPTSSQSTPAQSTPVAAMGRTAANAPRKSTRLTELATRRAEPASSRVALFAEPERPHARATHSSRNRINAGLNSDTENASNVVTRTRSGMAASSRSTPSTQRGTNPVRSSTRIADASKNKTPSQRTRKEKQPLVSRNPNLSRSLSGSTNSVASSSSRPSEDDMGQAHPPSGAGSAFEGDEPMDTTNDDSDYKKFFNVYQQVAVIEEAIHTFNWRSADALFAELGEDTVMNASMVRLQLGRACFEQSEYRECRTILEQLQQKKKWKVEGMELLSTALWHLQDSHALSTLAQGLTTYSRERAQTWCAAGNCFSLQRQHAQAIECMERALQLDKRFAYAHTLLGHELIVQDELDRAAGSFRSALLLAPRDYRAWYGIGLVHLKKEQALLALANIQKAVSINPTNRAMLCTLSQIEQQRGQLGTALTLIDRALALNPLDVACRFNKARLLFEAKRNEDCLAELDKLKAGSPDEAFVFHLLARVHRRMGNTHMALLNYSWAAELDPRGEQNIAENGGLGSREEYEDDEYGSPV